MANAAPITCGFKGGSALHFFLLIREEMTETMEERKRVALGRALLVGFFAALPVAYLFWLNASDPTKYIADGGAVPEFAYAANEGTAAFTHYDTFKRVSLLLLVPGTRCEAECRASLELFDELKFRVDRDLRVENKNDPHPQHPNFVIFSRFPLSHRRDDQEVKRVHLNESQPWIAPGSTVELDFPVFVIVSQDSRFRGVISFRSEDAAEKIQRMISRLSSDTFLFHYLAVQSLLWRNTNNYIRGRPIDDPVPERTNIQTP
jgi:hypothetical protein